MTARITPPRPAPKLVRVEYGKDVNIDGPVYTILDPCQLAFEAAVEAVHSRCGSLASAAEQQRFREKVAAWALETAVGDPGHGDPELGRLHKFCMMLAARVDRASEVLGKVAERPDLAALAALLVRPVTVNVTWPGFGRRGVFCPKCEGKKP